jgi:transposase-like protein
MPRVDWCEPGTTDRQWQWIRAIAFRGRRFTSEVILWTLRWYLAFPISYRDLALMLSDRGVVVDHTTLFRWVQATGRQWRSGQTPPPTSWITRERRW